MLNQASQRYQGASAHACSTTSSHVVVDKILSQHALKPSQCKSVTGSKLPKTIITLGENRTARFPSCCDPDIMAHVKK